MNRGVVFLGAALVIGVFVWFLAEKGFRESEIVDLRGNPSVRVVLTDEGYEPRYLRIDQGTVVTFSTTRESQHWPASNLHPTHEIYSEFDPKRPLSSTEAWSFRFEEIGEWGVHDHVRSYYTGIIYVGE